MRNFGYGSVLVSGLAIAAALLGCTSSEKRDGVVESQQGALAMNWEGWLDRNSQPPTLLTAPTPPSGGQVQKLARATSGGDFFSPWIPVVGGQSYCVQAEIKWVSGSIPFVGVQPGNAASPIWVIGAAYDDAYGATTVVGTSSQWQVLKHTIVPGEGVTAVRLVNELWDGVNKGGTPLAYFGRIALDAGACSTINSIPYQEDFEQGAAGWTDGSGSAASLVADPDGQHGQVQVIARNGSGGDYHSPWIGVAGGQSYCVRAKVKWVSGGAPFLGLELGNGAGPVWIIGTPYTDAFGATTEIDAGKTSWQTLSHSVTLPEGTTQIRISNELYGGAAKAGDPLAYFDGMGITDGVCLPYEEQFEQGAGGWADGSGSAASLVTDPDGLHGQVQVIDRNRSGGDYRSPWIGVTGGQSYCVQTKVKWVGGGAPFIALELAGGAGPAWIIGAPYTDAFGATTEIDAGTTSWQTLSHSVTLPESATQIRLVNELYGGAAKAGDPLAYFDGMGITDGVCLPYEEQFEQGAGGWADGSGSAASLVTDPDGLHGQVQVIDRNGSGGDYRSPWIGVTGGQSYCVQTKVKWVGGGAPFIALELAGGAGPVWIIGAPYTDAFGATTEINPGTTSWQTLSHSVTLPEGTTQIRLWSELYGGAAKEGSPLAYFDGLGVTAGACAPTVLSIPYAETFELGAGGWVDGSGSAASLVADPDGLQGQVQMINRNGSGGDYRSPWIGVTGGQSYCVQTKVKWVGGGAPFIALELAGGAGPVWIIGAPYTDAFGATTEIDAGTTSWQTLSHTVALPEGTTQIRLNNELYGGAAKEGSPLAYFDSFGVTSGSCAPTVLSIPYTETFESGAGGWADGSGSAASVMADPDGQRGQVQVIDRNGSGGDYHSPWINVVGGESYCVHASIKWMGGGTPFVGVQSRGEAAPVWVIGSTYDDAYGPTTAVDTNTTGWQTLNHMLTLPAGVTQIRLSNELFAGVSKPGSSLAYFDSLSISSGSCTGDLTSPAVVSLVGASATAFGPTFPALTFNISQAVFKDAPEAVQIEVNDVVVPNDQITRTATSVAFSPALQDGSNTVVLLGLDSHDLMIAEKVTLWAGNSSLSLGVVDQAGAPVSSATVTAKLGDDPSVHFAGTTDENGLLTIPNLPDYTIILEAKAAGNLFGAEATHGAIGSLQMRLLAFHAPSLVDNNNLNLGTDGWDIGGAPVTIIAHQEGGGPKLASAHAPAADKSLSRAQAYAAFQAAHVVPPTQVQAQEALNNDLRLSTSGEGPQTISRTFTVPAGVKSAKVRYKFITSEVPGGYFGTRYNDYYRVSIRSLTAGGSITDGNTMNGLGLAAFDANGATAWREAKLPIDSTGDTVQIEITVANVADGLYDSQVLVDYVATPSVAIGDVVAVVKGKSVKVPVSLGVPGVSINLSLAATGTGAAVFAANDGTSLTVTQTTDVEIKGIAESSKHDNIRLEAKSTDGESLDTEDFSVLWVAMSLRTSGSFSTDNGARNVGVWALGSDSLGTRMSTGVGADMMWRNVVEIAGTVSPPDFPRKVSLVRAVVGYTYAGSTRDGGKIGPDNSMEALRDDAPAGGVYDIDGPGIGFISAPTGTIRHQRANFHQHAEYNGQQCSDDLAWYSTLSVERTDTGDILSTAIAGDNTVGVGSTKLTWDLQ